MKQYELRDYQKEAVAAGIDCLNGKKNGVIVAPTGCLCGDTEIQINNRKNSKKLTIKEAYERYNGLCKHRNYNWKYKDDIYTRSMVNNKISLNKIENILYSGKKYVIELKFDNGYYLRLTPEHKIYSTEGWIEANSALGKSIAYDYSPLPKKHTNKYSKRYDSFYNIGEKHPYSKKVIDKRCNSISYRIEIHRAIYEANVNGFKDVEEYKKHIELNGCSGLLFFSPDVYHIHHKDLNHQNNNPDNLIHLTITDHLLLHSEKSKDNFGQGLLSFTKCVSVKAYGIINTYDIWCKDPNNNFVANGIIVHNSGKSLLISSIANQLGGKTIVLQPSKEILEQNLQKMRSFGYADIGVYSASMGKRYLGDITFATIGSIIRKKHLFKDFDRVIIDECHLVNSKGGMYENFINHLDIQTIGLTATPYRMRSYNDHKRGFPVAEARILTRTRPRIFNEIIHITQVKDLFDRGYLSGLEYSCYDDYDSNQIQINSTGMGFKDKDLQSYNKMLKITEKIVNSVRGSNAKHCLAFTQFRSESQEVVEGLRKYNIRCEEVSGETPKDQRESILTSFKMGVIKCVVNVGVLTTGFDFPELDCVVLGRPTKSVGLFYQMVGRGVRKAEKKESCKLIDLCGNVKTFGHIETFELVDPRGKKLWRLKSDRGYLTGVNLITSYDLESTNVEIQTDPESDAIIIPFGKYKDMPITAVNDGYLEWAVENFNNKDWKEIFTEELQRRRSLQKA